MVSKRPRANGGTAQRILDSAERLVQSRGFNGFSYADIASELGVTKASLHYHFAGKAELGEAIMDRYTTRFTDALAVIATTITTGSARLNAYADLFSGPLDGQRMCLCGMLAAEYHTLPERMRSSVIAFFDTNEMWVENVLEQGLADRSLSFSSPPSDIARMIVSSFEGAMLIALPYADAQRFQTAAQLLLASLAGAAGEARGE